MVFYNRKKSKAEKEADRAYAQMSKTINIRHYAGNVSRSVAISAKDAFLDLNPTIREISNHTGNGIKNVKAKYKERMERKAMYDSSNGLNKTSKLSLKELAMAVRDAHKEAVKGDSIDVEELSQQGISLDPSKFALEAEEKKLFSDGDQINVNTKNIILKSDNKSVATLSSTILTSAMSIVRVNQQGFQSVLTGIGELASTNVQFYNDMNSTLNRLNEQMSNLNRLSRIDTVGGMSTSSAIDELVMGNFTMANMMQAFKDAKNGKGKGGSSVVKSAGLGFLSSYAMGKLKNGGMLKNTILKAKNLATNAPLTIYDMLDSNAIGNSKIAQRVQGMRNKKGFIGNMARKIIPRNFAGNGGVLNKGSKFLKGLLFGDLNFGKGELDTSNNLSKGTAVAFDAETHNTINTVIPGYLGKILAHFTKGPEQVYNYDTGKWTTVDKARDLYNKRIASKVSGNEMVENLGKRIFGEEKVPEKYNDLMVELAKNRDLKPQDIKKLSDKYGEAAYTLYESIFKNEEMMKDFKVARNSASREVFTVSKNKEFSGSMLNAFNDKIDFVNDAQVEASQTRAKEIKKINKVVSDTNVLLGGKANGEGNSEKEAAEGNTSIFEDAKGLLGRFRNSRFLQGEGKTRSKIRGWLDKTQGKVDSLEGKLFGRGKKEAKAESGEKVKDKVKKVADKVEGTSGTKGKVRSFLSSIKSKLGKGGSAASGIIEGSGGLSMTSTLASLILGEGAYKGITKMIDPESGEIVDDKPNKNKPASTAKEQISDLTDVLDKIGESKTLSNSKLGKMFKKSPAARSVMDFFKNMTEKGWFSKATDMGGKLSPMLGEGWDLWAAGKQVMEGNPLGGLIGYGMSKAGTKFGGKWFKNPLVKYGAEMAGSMVGTKLGHSIGRSVNKLFGGGEAKAEDGSGPTPNPMQGNNVFSGADTQSQANVQQGYQSVDIGQDMANGQGDPNLNSIAQVGKLAQEAYGSGATLSSINDSGSGNNPITQSVLKPTPLNNSNGNPMSAVSSKFGEGQSTATTSSPAKTGPILNGENPMNPDGEDSSDNGKLSIMDFFSPFNMIKKGTEAIDGTSTAKGSNGFLQRVKDDNNASLSKDPNKQQVDTASLSSPTNGILGSLFALNDSMTEVIKKNPIIADMQKNPTTMAKKLLAFTPLGAAFHMMDNGFDPINPSSTITSSIDNYFEDLADAMDEFIELAEKAASGGGGGGGDGSGGGFGGNVSASDIDSFLKTSIDNNFGCDPDKMYKDVAGYTKVKHYFGGNIDQIKKATERIKSNGVSPEWFWAYEGQEQGLGFGWLNHFQGMGDPWSNIDKTCSWIKEASNGTYPLAWYDAQFPTRYVTPKEKQEKGTKIYNSLPKGSIGRVYLTGTAAATWAAFDPEALKGAVNGVQDYGDPMKGCVATLKKWGSGSGNNSKKGDSKASVSDEDSKAMDAANLSDGGGSSSSSGSTASPSSKDKKDGDKDKKDGDSKSSEGGDSKSSDAPPERSASLAKWDDDMQNKVIERVVKKYQLMYDELNGKKEKAAAATANAAAGKIDNAKKSIAATTSGDKDSGSSSSATASDGNVAYVDDKGNVIINGGDPESLAVAKNKLKAENDILDILRKILKATKDISGYTKQALEKLVKMIKEIETQTDLTQENNEVSEITNELLKRLNIEGGGLNSIGLVSNPNEFELPNDMLIPIYRGY